ncbi:MAG: aminotransferase class V-fold PLP-dependent enzyme, partial [Deltaproteobacteria bacterium]|nr:aminotransferase class V-fold PLP-dependent enzyme [Deltaproteobacteria bacterium]
SAAAEAILMAHRVLPKRHVVAISRTLWPDYRATIRTYLSALGTLKLIEVPFDSGSGTLDLVALEGLANDELLCTITGYPNAFGVIEPLGQIAELSHRAGALAISATAEPLALGLLKPPGALGVDIAVGEGQSFGMPLQFGGPGLGFLAGRNTHLRQMPGRLVGQTRDSEGHRAYCLTLATREQHIRRERATSNICTNHSLCALAATAYLSLLGRQGLRELAARNVELAHEAATKLEAAGIQRRFSGQYFNEFTVEIENPEATLELAEERGILAGLTLSRDYPELGSALLISVTEMNSAADFERLGEVLAGGR